MTPAQAYDSILTQADPPLRDRPEDAARRAVECAKAIIGSSQSESFGWHRRQKREGLLDAQLAILRQHASNDIPPGEHIGSGGEHDVSYSEHDSHVSKVTNKAQFGYAADQQNDNRGNKLHLRPALPSEYLLRLGTQNVAFGDAITLQGVQAGPVPRIITAQPYVDEGRPRQEEIDEFLRQAGFIRLPDHMMMSQFFTKPFWWRPADSVITGDVNPENFSWISEDIIAPFDIVVHPIPRRLVEDTARQNGVDLNALDASESTRTQEAV